MLLSTEASMMWCVWGLTYCLRVNSPLSNVPYAMSEHRDTAPQILRIRRGENEFGENDIWFLLQANE